MAIGGRLAPASCYLCGSFALDPLPELPGGRCATTDGQLLDIALEKHQCLGCALVQSDPGRILTGTRFNYEATYDFYARPLMRAFERERYRSYADWIDSYLAVGHAQTVLEIGCGDGWVLEMLREAHPSIRFHGLEASAAAARRAGVTGLDVRQGSLDASGYAPGQFDFVYSINVIEHVADPTAFLRGARALLSPGGAALMVCPCANVIDPELLFADHLYSYTRKNLETMAHRAGFRSAVARQGAGMLYPFQALYCGGEPAEHLAGGDPAGIAWWPDAALAQARCRYFTRWAGLDRCLVERLGGCREVVCFGAGETTDLLRAHAPETWRRIGGLMIDRPPGTDATAPPGRVQGLPLDFTGECASGRFDCILMGVKPRHQPAISDRLRAFGRPVVCWDDLVPEPFV